MPFRSFRMSSSSFRASRPVIVSKPVVTRPSINAAPATVKTTTTVIHTNHSSVLPMITGVALGRMMSHEHQSGSAHTITQINPPAASSGIPAVGENDFDFTSTEPASTGGSDIAKSDYFATGISSVAVVLLAVLIAFRAIMS